MSAIYASPHKQDLYASADIAADLRALLKGAGWKQYEMADAMEVSTAYVSDMLNGRRNMTPKFLNSFLDMLQANPITRLSMNMQAAREAGWKL